MLPSLLLVGFLLGLRHALDPDHVVAVAALAARRASWREMVRVAAAWGLGHSVVLVVLGGALILVGASIPEGLARALEGVVGLMLVALGIDVLLRARHRHRHAHVHAHTHGHGHGPGAERLHVHVHAHPGEPGHAGGGHGQAGPADHAHAPGTPLRALLVGGVHGLAGTAGLMLLAVPAMRSSSGALLYVICFGAGTIGAMVAASLLLSIPLSVTVGRLGRGGVALEALLGAGNVAIGVILGLQAAGLV